MSITDAVSHKDVAGVKRLLASGADPNTHDLESGDNLLAIAAAGGDCPTVTALLDAGADPNSPGTVTPPIVAAASIGSAEIVSLLLAHSADVNMRDSEGATALIAASAGGYAELVAALLRAGASAKTRDRKGISPIIAAAEKRHWAITETLKAVSTQEDQRRAAGIARASKQNVPSELVDEFLSAAMAGDLSRVQALVSAGVPVDVCNRGGTTALMRAANRGRLEVVQWLIDHGADPVVEDIDGWSALRYAAGHHRPDVYALLYPLYGKAEHRRVAKEVEIRRLCEPAWRDWKPPESPNRDTRMR